MIREPCPQTVAAGLSALCLLMTGAPLQAATIYKCVDQRGQVEYSSLPCPGGVRMEFPADAPPAVSGDPQGAQTGKSRPPGEKTPFAGYSRFAIASPQGAEVIRDNSGSGTVPVQLSIVPALRSDLGHAIAVYLDGVKSPQPYSSPQFALSGLTEGTHVLRAAVVGPSGSELVSTDTVTFGLLRVTALTPRGPGAEQPGAEDQPRLPGTPPLPEPMGEPQPGTEGQPRMPSKPPLPAPMTPPAPAPTPLPAPQAPLR